MPNLDPDMILMPVRHYWRHLDRRLTKPGRPNNRLMKLHSNPKLSIPSDETRTITHETEGVFEGGRWTEIWLEFSKFSDSVYS